MEILSQRCDELFRKCELKHAINISNEIDVSQLKIL
jgi:hypothetical protein